mgnify:CR=1 FL=1
MILLLIVFVLIVALAVIFTLKRYGKVEFVSHAKLLFKAWSVWLASAGSALMAWIQSFPDSAITAWNALPPDIKSFLPSNYLSIIASSLVALAVISQFVRQKKLNEKKKELDSENS